ncbi:MAG: phenylacetate--CoA ligase family protein [Anaerolineae bacterium]
MSVQPSPMYPHLDTATREELLAVQLKRLKYQMEYVYHNSPFYRRRFDKAKVRPEDIKSADDLRRLPLLTKRDLLEDQAENPPYGSRLCVSEDKINMVILTSGTSGVGQEVYAMTRMDVEFGGSAWTNWYYRCGLRKGDQLLLTWPLGTNSGPQGAFLGAYKLGANAFPIAPYDTKTKIETYMKKFDPVGLLVTPAYLSHLTILCQEMGLEPRKAFPHLKTIMIATEAYPITWAEKMEEVWGAKIHELYGNTQQGGLAAGDCEKGAVYEGRRGCLHMDEWNTLFEVLGRESGEPVSSGQEGELVLTNLNREGSPLVRFRTEDRVIYLSHKECDCGRPTACLEAGTIARYDDMMKIKTQNVWPEAVDAVIFAYEEVDEYNGRVWVDDRGREQVTISLEFKNIPLADDLKKQRIAQIEEELRRNTGVSMAVEEVPYGTLERFIFKTRRWTDERKKGLERVRHVVGGAKRERID